MNPRPLLIATLMIGSALLGATLAIRMYPHSASVPVGQLVQPSPVQSDVEPMPASSAPTVPAATLDQAEIAPPDEFRQIRIQLRRAIRDRNLVLLRSLIQAGSVREALRSVGAAETMNFENFDQSTWTVLEKALNYHCRQSIEDLDPGSCFEHQSPQPLP